MAAIRTRDRTFSRLVDPQADTVGFTPLHYGCLASDPAVIRVLTEYHADPELKDSSGHRAVEYTDSNAVRSLLEAHASEHLSYKESEARKKQAEAAERRRLYPLEKRVKEHLVGQIGPINAVAAAIRRRENGWCGESPAPNRDLSEPRCRLCCGSTRHRQLCA